MCDLTEISWQNLDFTFIKHLLDVLQVESLSLGCSLSIMVASLFLTKQLFPPQRMLIHAAFKWRSL